MPMGLKFCGCRACRMYKGSTRNRIMIARCKRQLKLQARNDMRKGREIITTTITVPYTD